jgi:hypothetical protein
MVRLTCIGVSSLLGNIPIRPVIKKNNSPTYQTAHIDECKIYRTAYTAVSLRMNPRDSKHIKDIKN